MTMTVDDLIHHTGNIDLEAQIAALATDEPPARTRPLPDEPDPEPKTFPPGRYDIAILKRKSGFRDAELAARLPCGWCPPCRRGRAHHCEHPGLSERQLHRKKHDGLTNTEADRYAIACNLHPAWVWPGWDGDRQIGDVTRLPDNGSHDGPP